MDLCDKFKQDSVYVQGPDEAPVYLDKDGNQTSSKSTEDFNSAHEFEIILRKAGPSTYFDRMKREKQGEVFLD